jgi:hypothetical protein
MQLIIYQINQLAINVPAASDVPLSKCKYYQYHTYCDQSEICWEKMLYQVLSTK